MCRVMSQVMNPLKPIYSFGIWVCRQGVRVAANSGNIKARRLNDGLNGVFQKLENAVRPLDRNIWIHAASLGEFEQGRPLMERLRACRPELKIILTFFSPSGYEVRKSYAGADVVSYLPFDTPRNVRRFLEIVNPEKAIFVKYEFWMNYLDALHKRNIETYLISGIFRPEQLFFRTYGGFYRRVLRDFTTLYLQDHGSRRLLEGIGISNTKVAGDTRFDRVADIRASVKPDETLSLFCGPQRNERRAEADPVIFMAGSSWPEDEKIYLDWLLREEGVKGVIAPHEFDELRLKKLLDLCSGNAVLLSDARRDPTLLSGKKILIIDCFGLLSSAYSYADIAYVGGGFGAGLHNINEAAVYGIPVMFGPNHHKFIEAGEMKTLGAGIPVDGKSRFEHHAIRLVRDSKERLRRGKWAAEYIASKTGASDIIFSDLFGT